MVAESFVFLSILLLSKFGKSKEASATCSIECTNTDLEDILVLFAVIYIVFSEVELLLGTISELFGTVDCEEIM